MNARGMAMKIPDDEDDGAPAPDVDLPYAVGNKKPPKHSQFKRGHSGNPKGRPKGSDGVRKRLGRMLNGRVSINNNGKSVKLSRLDRGLLLLADGFSKGDWKCVPPVLKIMEGDETRQAAEQTASDFAMPDEANLAFIYKRLSRHFKGGPDDSSAG